MHFCWNTQRSDYYLLMVMEHITSAVCLCVCLSVCLSVWDVSPPKLLNAFGWNFSEGQNFSRKLHLAVWCRSPQPPRVSARRAENVAFFVYNHYLSSHSSEGAFCWRHVRMAWKHLFHINSLGGSAIVLIPWGDNCVSLELNNLLWWILVMVITIVLHFRFTWDIEHKLS